MPGTNNKYKQSPKRTRKPNNQGSGRKPKQHTQTAGAESNICSKDINQLLMGNPPVSIGGVDVNAVWKDTKKTGRDLDKYGKTGWGNYPGTPPKPDCAIL